MNYNMKMLRECSGLQAKEIAKLLNVSVYTYFAFEQDRMSIPDVLKIMIGTIYSIDSEKIFSGSLLVEDLHNVSKLKALSKEERFSVVVTRLFGEDIKVNYHQVSKLKEKILRAINDGDNTR